MANQKLVPQRRRQILDAASKVFAAKGYAAATIKGIAQEADVASGTVYLYFPNKSALLLGMLERLQEIARQNVDPAQIAALSLRDVVRIYLERPLTIFETDNFELFRVLIAEVMVNAEMRNQFFSRVLAPMIDAAEVHLRLWSDHHGMPPGRAALVVRSMSSLVFGLIVQRILGDTNLEANWDTLPDVLSDLLVNGIEGTQQ